MFTIAARILRRPGRAFCLSPEQWRRIADHQRREISDLVDDSAEAKRRSHLPAYACVGDWLTAGQGGRVLELGCGPGRFVAMMAQLGYEIVGVDPVAYDDWDRIRAQLPVTLLNGIRAEQLPFSDSQFDHVTCLGALLYFEDPERALAEIRRVMKSGGRLIVRTVNRNNFYTLATGRKLDPASRNIYSEDELRTFLESAGFSIARSFTYGFWPPVGTMYWWYLLNGVLSQRAQMGLSRLTPARHRHNITVFATRA